MITVFSKHNCMQCKFTKKYLTENDIPFEEKNVTGNKKHLDELRSLFEDRREIGLPVVLKDEQIVANGFKPKALETLKVLIQDAVVVLPKKEGTLDLLNSNDKELEQ